MSVICQNSFIFLHIPDQIFYELLVLVDTIRSGHEMKQQNCLVENDMVGRRSFNL